MTLDTKFEKNGPDPDCSLDLVRLDKICHCKVIASGSKPYLGNGQLDFHLILCECILKMVCLIFTKFCVYVTGNIAI